MVALVPRTLLAMLSGRARPQRTHRTSSQGTGMRILQRPLLPGVDAQAALAEARQLIGRRVEQPARRAFLQRTLTLGGLSMLTGCSISDNAGVEAALTRISQFNDQVQGLDLRPHATGADLPGVHDHAALPVQRLLRRRRDPPGGRRHVPAGSDGPGGRQAPVDLARVCAPCSRPTRSPATSAWKAGAPSASGAACASPTSWPAWAPTPVPNSSVSSAPTITSPASTCRPPCTRNGRCWR